MILDIGRPPGPNTRQKLPKPAGKQEIVEWFKNTEKVKGTGLNRQTNRVQPWFHGEY